MTEAPTGRTPTFDERWEEMYAEGLQRNRWPFDHVVSFYNRSQSRLSVASDGPIKLMEVGFGAGNNLFAAASEGLDVYGIEASETAVTLAKDRFRRAGLEGDLRLGDFTKLPWDDEVFDLIVDRLAITHTTLHGAKLAVAEVRRTLKCGGFFHFNSFGPRYEGVSASDGEEGQVYRNDLAGSLGNVGGVSFYSKHGVRSLFAGAGWSLEAFQLVTVESVIAVTQLQPNPILTEWRVIARKVE